MGNWTELNIFCLFVLLYLGALSFKQLLAHEHSEHKSHFVHGVLCECSLAPVWAGSTEGKQQKISNYKSQYVMCSIH